jgi:hypothetical protein
MECIEPAVFIQSPAVRLCVVINKGHTALIFISTVAQCVLFRNSVMNAY